MIDDLDEVRALLPGVTVTPVDALGGSNRSAVRRARITRPGETPTTVIVKTFDQPGSWARESAALAVLPPHAPAPRLLAAGASPPVVVMSDLGTGTNVADALLGEDPAAAEAAVYGWTDAIAAVHRATSGLREAFRVELDARAQPGSAPLTSVAASLDQNVADLREACGPLGVAVPDTLADTFRAEAARLDDDAASALSPSDACPDNNVFTENGLALIDFEHAEWRHIAWDVAYLRVPWPSCWCSWRLPDDVADRAVARYRAAMAADLPYVATPEFDRDLAAATDLWAVLYSSWFLPQTLTGDPVVTTRLDSPRRRALLLHRLDLARRTSMAPEIAAFSGELRDALVGRWGEVPLALARAFRG
ncbi:phosphotransferase family protein [Catellatospora vulcania]|uniref:phosphotransferase n=1 Tax=Catellatospora vulcania TaxID=1460450 RepID=UPI0012D47993|nr:phosphotransferase [Catellatospora vulcania]